MMILGYLMRFKLSRGEWITHGGAMKRSICRLGLAGAALTRSMGALCLLLPLPIFPNNPRCTSGKAARPVRYW